VEKLEEAVEGKVNGLGETVEQESVNGKA